MKLYLKSRWLLILGPLIILAVATLMTVLLNQSFDLLFNTVFIGFVPLLFLWIFDFVNFIQQETVLRRQKKLSTIDLNSLPATKEPLSQLYQQLIQKEDKLNDQLKNQLADLKSDTYDTLQLWTHQIKTPLTALDLLLQVEPFDQKAARSEIKQIDRYLKVMLNYLKLTTVNTDLVLTRMSLSKVVKESVRDLAELFIAKNLRVVVADLPEVVCDEQWMKFIFEQILTNSIKYTPEGEIRVYWEQDALVFADTGIGILPEDLPRIFEQGYSGYNGRENKKASGLGLYLSNEIAKKIGLKLTAKSTVGVGTEIMVHFSQRNWLAE